MRTTRECQEDDEKMESKIEIAVDGLDELKEQTEELSDIVAAMNPQVVIKKAEGCTINIYTSLPLTTEG